MSGLGPLELSVVEDLRRPGNRRPVQRVVAAESMATSVAAVPEGSDVTIDVVVEAIGDDLVVAGTVGAGWVGECRRCLEPVAGTVELAVREVFEPHPVEGETYPLGDGVVDLGPMVREAVLLALPLAPLCNDRCVGPDPERFPAAAPTDGGDGAGDAEPARDPRWAALDALRFDDEAASDT